MAEPVKPCSPQMFAITNKVYASAKHLAVRGMFVDPDMLVFSWHKFSLYYIKKIFSTRL